MKASQCANFIIAGAVTGEGLDVEAYHHRIGLAKYVLHLHGARDDGTALLRTTFSISRVLMCAAIGPGMPSPAFGVRRSRTDRIVWHNYVSIDPQGTVGLGKLKMRLLCLSVLRESIDRTGRRDALPRALITDIDHKSILTSRPSLAPLSRIAPPWDANWSAGFQGNL